MEWDLLIILLPFAFIGWWAGFYATKRMRVEKNRMRVEAAQQRQEAERTSTAQEDVNDA